MNVFLVFEGYGSSEDLLTVFDNFQSAKDFGDTECEKMKGKYSHYCSIERWEIGATVSDDVWIKYPNDDEWKQVVCKGMYDKK